MTDQITIGSTTESGSRRWVAGVVAAVGAVAVLTGCTVSGTPSAPPQAVAQYKAEQVVKRQKANAQQVCSKDDLIRAVWPEDRVYSAGVRDDSLAQLVRRLRQKIESDPAHPQRLQTIPGRGYRFTG